jgi:hypothetical protein
MMNHWKERSKNWALMGPPKRPTEGVIRQIRDLVGDHGQVLVLGVTPGLVGAFTNVLAVDREPEMIARVHLGDTDTKHAELMDWFSITGENRFDAIVGDGSLNMVNWPYGAKILMDRLFKLLTPGGRLACRVFTCPDQPVMLEDLIEIAKRPPAMGFNAWRSKLSHFLAQEMGPNVPVREMLRAFNYHWPNRDVLAAASGWDQSDISMIMDAYANSDLWTSFPTRRQWMDCVPDAAINAEIIPTAGYELCEEFPILTFTKEL